jgi:hypothetical protein
MIVIAIVVAVAKRVVATATDTPWAATLMK